MKKFVLPSPFICCALAAITAQAQSNYEPYTIDTFAGLSGVRGSADGTGSAARFYEPEGAAVDSAGNLYVGDTENHTIRKITPAGVVTTLAGLALQSGSDDGTGSAARFAFPAGVAVDNAGNVYVADNENDTICKITSAGVVTTLAGLALDEGSNDGTGSGARFDRPQGVAVDSAGTVYVADTVNYTIRKITPAGVVTTWAGLAGVRGSADGPGSTARFYWPYGVAVDNAGNVYVVDNGNQTVRKITPAGVVSTLAGLAGENGSADGAGSAARFDFGAVYPTGIGVDSAGSVYVADTNNQTIRKITPAGVVTTLAGLVRSDGNDDGSGSAARFSTPCGVAVDSVGNIHVVDKFNDTIRAGVPDTTSLPAMLLNISTRLRVLSGDNELIGGFIITGNAAKRVIVRAIGPSLTNLGVPGALADPVLELHGRGAFVTITDDNWRDIQQAEIEATGLAPSNDLESAIVATLPPGA